MEAELMIRLKQDASGAKRLMEIIKSNPNHVEARNQTGEIGVPFL